MSIDCAMNPASWSRPPGAGPVASSSPACATRCAAIRRRWSPGPACTRACRSRWEPYQSLSPQFVTARARDLLAAAAGVTLRFPRWSADGHGSAGVSMDGGQRAAGSGDRRRPSASPTRARAGRATEGRDGGGRRAIPEGQSRITVGQDATLGTIADGLRALNDVARARGQRAARRGRRPYRQRRQRRRQRATESGRAQAVRRSSHGAAGLRGPRVRRRRQRRAVVAAARPKRTRAESAGLVSGRAHRTQPAEGARP